MESCLKLQTELGMKTMILTRNLKVGASGLEALYRKTREAGVVYVKFSDTLPTFQQDADGNVQIAFMDEITRMPFTVQADITVVDEAIAPSPYLKDLSRIFCLDTDSAGYIQSDNVHRLSVFTNRKGILAAGGSRGMSISFSPAGRGPGNGHHLVFSDKRHIDNPGQQGRNSCRRLRPLPDLFQALPLSCHYAEHPAGRDGGRLRALRPLRRGMPCKSHSY